MINPLLCLDMLKARMAAGDPAWSYKRVSFCAEQADIERASFESLRFSVHWRLSGHQI